MAKSGVKKAFPVGNLAAFGLDIHSLLYETANEICLGRSVLPWIRSGGAVHEDALLSPQGKRGT